MKVDCYRGDQYCGGGDGRGGSIVINDGDGRKVDGMGKLD